jgi:hypothetical protein
VRLSLVAREGIEPPTRGFSVLGSEKHPTSADRAGIVVAALTRQGVVSSSLQLSGVWSQVRTQVLALPPFAQEGPGRGICRVMRARTCAAGKCGWVTPGSQNKNSGMREMSSPSGLWREGSAGSCETRS